MAKKRFSRFNEQGYLAAARGGSIHACPYPPGSRGFREWAQGFWRAKAVEYPTFTLAAVRGPEPGTKPCEEAANKRWTRAPQ